MKFNNLEKSPRNDPKKPLNPDSNGIASVGFNETGITMVNYELILIGEK